MEDDDDANWIAHSLSWTMLDSPSLPLAVYYSFYWPPPPFPLHQILILFLGIVSAVCSIALDCGASEGGGHAKIKVTKTPSRNQIRLMHYSYEEDDDATAQKEAFLHAHNSFSANHNKKKKLSWPEYEEEESCQQRYPLLALNPGFKRDPVSPAPLVLVHRCIMLFPEQIIRRASHSFVEVEWGRRRMRGPKRITIVYYLFNEFLVWVGYLFAHGSGCLTRRGE